MRNALLGFLGLSLAVYGAGCQLALGADIRIADQSLKMAVMEMKWGIVPDMGGMVLLPTVPWVQGSSSSPNSSFIPM